MSRYRRSLAGGGTFFFTVTLADRRSRLLVEHIDRLRHAWRVAQSRYPFDTITVCILPDHLHAVWSLPGGEADFGRRWSAIKRLFSTGLCAAPTRSTSKIAKREKGIWQRRFWEHQIRDGADLDRHVDYVHFNSVKYGLAGRVSDWPYSFFHWQEVFCQKIGRRVNRKKRAASVSPHENPRGHAALCPPYARLNDPLLLRPQAWA